jgi:colanic acid/amylovoran biosynthesis glycosyltransferase
MNKVLYFFTSAFPYGGFESFIENEITYLGEVFDKVIIIPLYYYKKNSVIRPIPDNCKYLNPIIRNRWQHYIVGLFCFKTFKIFIKEFFKTGTIRGVLMLKRFFVDFCTTNNLLQSKAIKKVLQEVRQDDIMYFYWGKGASNILPFISKIKAKKIVRFHAGDLYGLDTDGYIILREAILKETDVAVFISKNGQNFMKSCYPYIKFNSMVSYLGTNDNGISKPSNDNTFRLISVSHVISVKRVFLIYEALQKITDYEIEWTHFGSGTDFEKLKVAVKNSRTNIRVKLQGQIPNKDLLMYYKTNMVDAFINVSITEGLPVSLMEAISFDVPVIGTNVGGTSEIVTKSTGILLSPNPTVPEIVGAINRIRHLSLHPRLFWEENFTSSVNYKKFINEVIFSQ